MKVINLITLRKQCHSGCMDKWTDRAKFKGPSKRTGIQNKENGWVNYCGRYHYKSMRTERNECFDSAPLITDNSEAL